ncbi:MAG: hypothetical protein ACI835_004653 [Planctomycetota bacterium]|jgi:hypothetical protein
MNSCNRQHRRNFLGSLAFALTLVLGLASGRVVPDSQNLDWRSFPNGSQRIAAFEAALSESLGSDAFQQVIVASFEAFQFHLDALEYRHAERLALAMHGAADASWSAWTLALISTRVGKHERALSLLEHERAQASTAKDTIEILGRQALAELGAGHEERARDLLGLALLMGSKDAAQILARLALSEQEWGRARALFGSLIPALPSPGAPPEITVAPWALRGWGLAQLP